MMRLGIIENVRSQRNKRAATTLAADAQSLPEACYASLEDIGDLSAILRDFARREVKLLVLSSGDGTVQATLTRLIEQRPFEAMPMLAIMPRGMTNMTAGDVGLRGSGPRTLGRLISAVRDGTVSRYLRTRHLLRVENIKDFTPQIGMFFGGAAIYDAIETCRRSVHSLKFEADLANGLTLAGLLLRWLVTGGRDDGVLRGHTLRVRIDEGEIDERECLLFLVTTLDRLILGSRPFWNDRVGHMRYTSIGYPPRRLLWFSRRILYGGQHRDLPDDSYYSRAADRLELRFDGRFTLDGEFFEPEPTRPLILTASETACFVSL